MSSQRDGWCRVDFCSSSATGLSVLPRPTYGGSSTYNSLGQDDRGQFLYSVLAFPTMNPVYSPVQPGTPYGNPKNVAYTGYPAGYPTTAPTYNPNIYSTSGPGYAPGYPAGTPYKVPPTQSNNAPPPYSPSPNPYQTAMYPIRSAYPQQNLYAQGAYYTQPVYAAQPHVIHHTTVVQPNSIPSAIYPAPVAAPRANGVAMGMVAGATMAMSAGTLLTTPQHTALGAHPVSVPTYRAQGTPTYSYIPPHW